VWLIRGCRGRLEREQFPTGELLIRKLEEMANESQLLLIHKDIHRAGHIGFDVRYKRFAEAGVFFLLFVATPKKKSNN
jgi:hypothetical protein